MTGGDVWPSTRRSGSFAGGRGGVFKHLLMPMAVAAAALTLIWMLALPGVLADRFGRATGFGLKPGSLLANPLSGHFRLTDTDLVNPPDWPSAPFLHIDRLETTVRPWTLRDQPLVLPRVVLDIELLTLVIGPDGRSNTVLLDGAFAELGFAGRFPFLISRLELSVNRIVVVDYSRGSPPRLAEYRPAYQRVHQEVSSFGPVWNDVLGSFHR